MTHGEDGKVPDTRTSVREVEDIVDKKTKITEEGQQYVCSEILGIKFPFTRVKRQIDVRPKETRDSISRRRINGHDPQKDQFGEVYWK